MRRQIRLSDNSLGAHCLRSRHHGPVHTSFRTKTSAAPEAKNGREEREDGAMTQRLKSLIEDDDLSGTRAEDVQDFNPELKDQLLQRIQDGKSARRLNEQAFSVAELPSSAGRQARDIASAPAWQGSESVADASLRMLNDSYKPMRVPKAPSTPARVPKRIDTGRPSQKSGSAAQGKRLANARDKTSTYAFLKDPNLSDEERQKFRESLKARFGNTSRTVPVSIKGLTSLANERIEDAIARGQFKNLPRGAPIERDYTASSSFVDTTSYLLNRMIKRQDVVPYWIELQQQLLATATRFRARLRSDWRRHAARTIAAAGGSLESQIMRAEKYAAAELAVNPPKRKQETVNTVSDDGHLSQISLSGELRVPAQGEAPQPETTVTVERAPELERQVEQLASDGAPPPAGRSDTEPAAEPKTPDAPGAISQTGPVPSSTAPAPAAAANSESSTQQQPIGPVFRDETWLAAEKGYHSAAIKELNDLARSYNLTAPKLAQKPYYNLERELKSCYADVAPMLPAEIRERALGPRAAPDALRGSAGRSLIDNLTGSGHVAQVRDENEEKQYGFKQFWRDVFGTRGA